MACCEKEEVVINIPSSLYHDSSLNKNFQAYIVQLDHLTFCTQYTRFPSDVRALILLDFVTFTSDNRVTVINQHNIQTEAVEFVAHHNELNVNNACLHHLLLFVPVLLT